MKRRWKIAAIVLVILFVFPLIVHMTLSDPTSLPIRKGDKIYLGATTVLGILTFPIGDAAANTGPSYTINFIVYTNSTLHGAWGAPGPLVNAYVYPYYGLKGFTHGYMGPVKTGVFNVSLNPGEYNLSFYLFPNTGIFWYTTFTITQTIQLIPDSSANATR